jgi:glucosyl-3-phosphoglycerate phosphatase
VRSPGTTRLILWRHGLTAWNAERRFQGQLDVPLTEAGLAGAKQMAPRLARLEPDLIVSSDLRRALDTAAVLAALTGHEVVRDARLRERYFGDWQGHTLPEIEQRWPGAVARWRAGEPVDEAGVEPEQDVAKRVSEALRGLVERAPGGTVIVATHGGAARRGIAAVLDWPDPVMRALGDLGNCHWSELRYQPSRGWRLWSHNVG